MLAEKTWVYWAGLLIVAFSVVGLIHGFTVLALPLRLIPQMTHAARFAAATMWAIVRLLGSLVFLGVGIYMMKSGGVVSK